MIRSAGRATTGDGVSRSERPTDYLLAGASEPTGAAICAAEFVFCLDQLHVEASAGLNSVYCSQGADSALNPQDLQNLYSGFDSLGVPPGKGRMAASLAHPPHKTWTRQEFEALESAGLLTDTRYELIEGEVFDKIGQNPPHAFGVCHFAALLIAIFGANRVRTQLPVEPAEAEATHSLPEPDIAVTREPASAYRDRHPGAGDILLIAEVADSTYQFDVKRKGRLYARAGFAEYVVLDLNERELLVSRVPRGGIYTEMRVLRPGEFFHSMHASEAGIPVAELFPD
jgi:Uma2 family endonuclease